MSKYSIVIPVYYNEGVLPFTMTALYNEVISANLQHTCEIIFIDDGSGDGSLDQLLKFREQYPEIVNVIKLTRNFGQVNAIMAGLSFIEGDCAIIMAADNQDPAELISDMLTYHFDEHFDIVIARRIGRDESAYRIWTSRIFYRLMQLLSFKNMPIGGFDYVLMSRRVTATLLRNQEATPFFQGQILWTGFSTKFIDYHRRKREIGKSRWTLAKKITYLLDGVIGYSFLPIRLMSIIGFIVAMSGFFYAFIIIISKLFWGLPVEGWAPLMVSILALGGMQMLMLGLIGEYLWRVLAQVRNRDPYVIDSIYPTKSAQEKNGQL